MSRSDKTVPSVGNELIVRVSSDLDYEFLIAEVEVGAGSVVIVSRGETGDVYVEIPRYDEAGRFSDRVRLEELMSALERARDRIAARE